jgi:phosphoenolpyruvate---glycerone phosphotransferase subunit DhaM
MAADTDLPEPVSLVLVSHSEAVAAGLADIVSEVAAGEVPVVAVGGARDGKLGTDGGRVMAALRDSARGPGAVVLMDIGSSVLAVRGAFADLAPAEQACLRLVDAPLVEGAVAAGALASTGASLDEVARAAEAARCAVKL